VAIRILLADDQKLFREALVHVLRRFDQDATVIHAASASEALAATSYYRDLDLILLCLDLPGADRASLIPYLREHATAVPVVALSVSCQERVCREALDAGAASCIPKTFGIRELLFAVERVLAGETYLPAPVLSALNGFESEPQSRHQNRSDKLTARQQEVMHLLSQGLSNKSIANRLDLCEGTVKLHVSAIMRTLGVHNRTEAVVAAGNCS
jgi:DNA-binding NarL/FixJ family response regulator